MAKFQSQLEAVERDMALARIPSGKISPVTTHAIGPQVAAKKAMSVDEEQNQYHVEGKER